MSYRKFKRAAEIRASIHTGGKKTPGLRFQGEQMTCVMCGKSEQSDPAIESGWTFVEIEGTPGAYVCPDELPGPKGTKQQFADAYEKIMRKVLGQP
jgi:hypothetical protein